MARTAQYGRSGLTAEQERSQRSALLRHKVLSPLSLAAAVLVTVLLAALPTPSLGQVSDWYVTIYTPRKEVVGVYWLLVFVLGLGYCVRLSLTSPPTPLAHTPAYSFPILFVLLAVWAALFVTEFFVPAFVVVCLMLLVAVWINVRVDWLGYRTSGFVDWAFTDLPLKLFLVVLLNLDLLQSLLLALRWYTYYPPDSRRHPQDPDPRAGPGSDSKQAWIVFGALTAIGLIDAGVVFAGKDVAWCLATIALWVAVMLGPKREPERTPQVFIPLILLGVLQIVVLVSSFGWHHVQKRREGAIALPADEEQSPFLRRQQEEQGATLPEGQQAQAEGEQRRRGGEIDEL